MFQAYERKNKYTYADYDLLTSGKKLALMTNLPFGVSQKVLEDLYYQRWEIEKKYHTLKNKMKFESMTGKSTIYVDQDFRAQVLVYSMIQDIRKEADDQVSVKGCEKNCRYPMHTNENIAIGLFKEQLIKLILEKREKRISQTNIKIIKKAVFKKSMQFPWGKYGLFSYNIVL